MLAALNQPPWLPRTGKVFVCVDAAEKGSGRGWELNCRGVNPARDPPQPHSSCRITPASSIPVFRAFTFEGGGQGGGRVPRADPADGQVALHAAPLVQHAGVHGRAWGRTRAHQFALTECGRYQEKLSPSLHQLPLPGGALTDPGCPSTRRELAFFPWDLGEELKHPWKCYEPHPSPKEGAVSPHVNCSCSGLCLIYSSPHHVSSCDPQLEPEGETPITPPAH